MTFSVRQVCDVRWRRFLISDGGGKFWTGQTWSDDPSKAMLFIRECDALRVGLRLHDGDTETLTATITVTVGKGEWSLEELRKYLTAWGRFVLLKNEEPRAVRVTIHWGGLEEDDVEDCG